MAGFFESGEARTKQEHKASGESEVGYRAIPIETPLRDYEPPELQIECVRCKRSANLKVQAMAKRFGMNVAIGDLVRQVALAGERPCG